MKLGSNKIALNKLNSKEDLIQDYRLRVEKLNSTPLKQTQESV